MTNFKDLNWLDIGNTIINLAQVASIIPSILGKSEAAEMKEVAAKVEAAVTQGKPKEAVEKALESWKLGFTLDDEMRLLRDVCILVDTKKLTLEDASGLMAFLSALKEADRTRFREAYSTEKEHRFRLMVLTTLAKLPKLEDGEVDERVEFLKGCGMFDPTSLEKFIEAIESPLAQVATLADNRAKTLKARRLDGEQSEEPKKKPSVLKTMFTFGLTKR